MSDYWGITFFTHSQPQLQELTVVAIHSCWDICKIYTKEKYIKNHKARRQRKKATNKKKQKCKGNVAINTLVLTDTAKVPQLEFKLDQCSVSHFRPFLLVNYHWRSHVCVKYPHIIDLFRISWLWSTWTWNWMSKLFWSLAGPIS